LFAAESLKPQQYIRRYRRFLERLKSARLDAGLTQVQAAARLGRPQSFISKCESGERRVDFVEAEMFATIYGRTVDFFRTDPIAAAPKAGRRPLPSATAAEP
jgi:transcriptional regulator with XRE-family HTH domain